MAAANTDKLIKAADVWSTTLSSGITDSDTTLTPATVTGLPTDTAVMLVIDRVDSSGTKTPVKKEVMVGVVSGGNIANLVRAVEGTAQAHTAGAVIEIRLFAAQWDKMVDWGLAEHKQDGTHGDVTADSLDTAVLKGWDGWLTDDDTWVYVTAATFKIVGKDVTARFAKGTKLKFSQTTTKYAVVAASSFSTDTTVTIIVNTTHVLANAAITAPFYSYAARPQGYPDYFAYTPTYTGFSANPTSEECKFSTHGNRIFVRIAGASAGTSNATGFTATSPVTAVAAALGIGNGVDNSSVLSSPSRCVIPAASAVITIHKDFASGAWTGSGNKYCTAEISHYF